MRIENADQAYAQLHKAFGLGNTPKDQQEKDETVIAVREFLRANPEHTHRIISALEWDMSTTRYESPESIFSR